VKSWERGGGRLEDEHGGVEDLVGFDDAGRVWLIF
jgi:hypothetical protein